MHRAPVFCRRMCLVALDLVISEGGLMIARQLSRFALSVALLAALAGAVRTLAVVGGGPGWGMIGNDSTNSRNQPLEHTIGPANANRLALKWVATIAGDVSATPAVGNGAAYVRNTRVMQTKSPKYAGPFTTAGVAETSPAM